MDESKQSEKSSADPGKPLASRRSDLIAEPVDLSAHWIAGRMDIPGGSVPVIKSTLSWADTFGAIKVRCAMGRYRYRISPGLYAVGSPTKESPVFVTANYKLSFDHLRAALHGIDAWIMVLNTYGINVWCAAGKGTFGTGEIVNRVLVTRLSQVVSHRRLIVPQLGAPGVAAHEVKESCGFSVCYGPVRAKDIPAFLQSGERTTPAMRRVRFNVVDRVVLIPTEIVTLAKYFLPAALLLCLLTGFGPDGYSLMRMVSAGPIAAGLFIVTFLIAAVMVPLLLPYLPGRAFSLKGAGLGLAVSAIFVLITSYEYGRPIGNWHLAAWPLLIISLSSFVAMNFTGSSTFTSLSGVRAEMRIAVPSQISGGLIGLTLWVIGLFVANGWKG